MVNTNLCESRSINKTCKKNPYYEQKQIVAWMDLPLLTPDKWIIIQEKSTLGNTTKTLIIKKDTEKEFKPYSNQLSKEVIEIDFKQLADQWRKEVIFLSSVEKIIMNQNYQTIIGMGPRIVPLILRELKKRPDYWFYALRMITRKNPVKPEDKGNIKKMAQAWIEWGKLNDLYEG
jgi:hypothetical protein